MTKSMFRNLRYEIDDENHIFNVTIPDSQSNVRNLVIKDEDGKLHVLCTSGEEFQKECKELAGKETNPA